MKTNYIKFLVPVALLTLTSCVEGHKKPNTKTGFIKVEDVSMVASDFNSAYAPSKGNVKMLVLPISFTGAAKDKEASSYNDWNTTLLNKVEDIYFGDSNSLKAYYSAASFNQLNISGMVAPVYQNSTVSTTDVCNDTSFNTLYDLIEDAVNWLQETRPSINWSEYDLNQDGCIDSIHLITNYHETEWGLPLWPHMSSTDKTGTLDKPCANVYSINSSALISDAITSIHEQGHIFGLTDYYDYTEDSEIDYVGFYDMQSGNCFDWNSFSKLSMGWVKPYVINGQADVTTVNIKAASYNGDCILIPANYSSWNGSAFDEYFLLELFAPYGNNRKDWEQHRGSLGYNPGIRLYHIDSRMYGNNEGFDANQKLTVNNLEEQQINSLEDISKWAYNDRGTNNSSDWLAGNEGIEQLSDKPIISIVQKGGRFTFASQHGRHELSSADLFKVGDTFDFDTYSIFLNKDAEAQELTNKGEEFPYTFTIDYIDEDDATITFYKVKH